MLENIEITDEVLEEVKYLRELITMLRDQISNLTPQSPKSHGQTMNVLISGKRSITSNLTFLWLDMRVRCRSRHPGQGARDPAVPVPEIWDRERDLF